MFFITLNFIENNVYNSFTFYLPLLLYHIGFPPVVDHMCSPLSCVSPMWALCCVESSRFDHASNAGIPPGRSDASGGIGPRPTGTSTLGFSARCRPMRPIFPVEFQLNAGIPPGKSDASGGIGPKHIVTSTSGVSARCRPMRPIFPVEFQLEAYLYRSEFN